MNCWDKTLKRLAAGRPITIVGKNTPKTTKQNKNLQTNQTHRTTPSGFAFFKVS